MSNFSLLLTRPHFATDLRDRVISCHEMNEAWKYPFIDLLNGRGEKIGQIKCHPEDKEALFSFFYSDDQDFQQLRKYWETTSLEILNRDIEGILHATARESANFSETLYRCCLFIRSYLMVENCSIFGLIEGSLTGLMAVMPQGSKSEGSTWNYSSMNIASVALKAKRPYVCLDTTVDPNFIASQDEPGPRDLICYPILNQGEPIGIINVSKKVSGTFTDTDLRAIQKFSTVISQILRQEFERRRSEKFLNTSANLGKYLSTSVVREIARTGTSGDLGGEIKKVVALFCDIRSFTTITEGMNPALVVKLLNFYFEEMNAIIDKYNGTVDKLVGDMMVVVWNIPNEQPEPELLAMKCALEMQKAAFRKISPEWARNGVEKFSCGIGINAGQAVVGNIGSSRFRNYTVIGNTINTAQRLESQAGPGEIWVHENLAPMLQGKVVQPERVISDMKLKGLQKPVSVYVFRAAI